MEAITEMQHAHLAKADVADAFRLLPVHPLDHNLLGFKYNKEYYYDTRLPMGCAAYCKNFESFSDTLVFILADTHNVKNVIKVLDDFLFIWDKEDE